MNIYISQSGEKQVALKQIERYSANADVVVLQAPGHLEANELINFFRLKGKKVVVDYDDYSFDLSPMNPRYAELGIKECELFGLDGKPIYRWKDGENGFDLQSNISRYNGFVGCVKDADMVTTTTEYLASKFRPLNPNVRILPNSVDMALWKPVNRPEAFKDQVRIGWFGGDSHGEDLWVFKEAIPKVMRKYPQVKLVLQAPMVESWLADFKSIPPERVEWYPWADLKFYTLFLASRQFDIGLCPLNPDSEFNKCKSGIKQFEFGAFKVPAVCQDMLPYSEVVKEGHNGFLATTAEDWVNKISLLVEDASLRASLGEAAYQEVSSNHNLEKNCLLWEEAYLSLLEAKNERAPGRSRKRDSAGLGARP